MSFTELVLQELTLVSVAADAVYRIVATAAIVVGGGWAYLKYIRGRAFTERLELSVDGTASAVSGVTRVVVSCTVSNVGTRRVQLKKDDSIVAVRVLALQTDPDVGNPEDGDTEEVGGAWVEVNRQAVFEEIGLLEPGESANDAALIQVPQAANPLGAIRLELHVYSAKTGKDWSAKKVVLSPAREHNNAQ